LEPEVTKVIQKEMFPIGGEPAIHYIVEEAAASGIEEILMIVSRNKNLLVHYFDHSLELEAFLQRPYANDLGDAVLLGKRFAQNEPVAVLLPDDILIISKQPGLKQLIQVYENVSGQCRCT
jgi:UTP--glucose-1-phosphate uridylyltransferase